MAAPAFRCRANRLTCPTWATKYPREVAEAILSLMLKDDKTDAVTNGESAARPRWCGVSALRVGDAEDSLRIGCQLYKLPTGGVRLTPECPDPPRWVSRLLIAGCAEGVMSKKRSSNDRSNALGYEAKWQAASAPERQQLHDELFQSIADKAAPHDTNTREFTASEWYGASVPDQPPSDARPLKSLSGRAEIARRRSARIALPTISIDDAIVRLMATLSCIPVFAANFLMAAIRAGELKAFGQSGELTAEQAGTAKYWPSRYAGNSQDGLSSGSIFVGLEKIDPRAIRFSETEFDQWLSLQASLYAAAGYPSDGATDMLPIWHAEREERVARIKRRQDPIINKLRRTREWINFKDIADWCARESGSIVPNEKLRSDTYNLLGEALADGFFGAGRAARVLFLNPISTWAKLTQERYNGIPGGEEGRHNYLRWCWIPRDLAGAWFDSKNLSRPAHLFQPHVVGSYHLSEPIVKQQSGESKSAPTGSSVREWMRQRVEGWPNDRPAASEQADWEAARAKFGDALTQIDFRQVRREETPAAWRKQGRRKPWGKLRNSVD